MWQQANCGYAAKMRMHEIVMEIYRCAFFSSLLLTSFFEIAQYSCGFLQRLRNENNNFSSGINWVKIVDRDKRRIKENKTNKNKNKRKQINSISKLNARTYFTKTHLCADSVRMARWRFLVYIWIHRCKNHRWKKIKWMHDACACISFERRRIAHCKNMQHHLRGEISSCFFYCWIVMLGGRLASSNQLVLWLLNDVINDIFCSHARIVASVAIKVAASTTTH